MNLTKFLVALAIFVSSVNFEEQVLVTKNGITTNWNVSFAVSVSHAAAKAF